MGWRDLLIDFVTASDIRQNKKAPHLQEAFRMKARYCWALGFWNLLRNSAGEMPTFFLNACPKWE